MHVIYNNKTKQWIGVDELFGGYYFDCKFYASKRFTTKKEAREYRDLWPDEDWSLHRIITSQVDWDD